MGDKDFYFVGWSLELIKSRKPEIGILAMRKQQPIVKACDVFIFGGVCWPHFSVTTLSRRFQTSFIPHQIFSA
jgi:hypothetical protein